MDNKLYLVISYLQQNSDYAAQIKVNGIYQKLELAIERQLEILEHKIKIVNNYEKHIYTGFNNRVSWIKESNLGDLNDFDIRPI